MRSSPARAYVLLAVTVAVLSLTGCSGPFTDTVRWRGGTFHSSGSGSSQVDDGRISLTLRTDGSGFAVDLPRGYRNAADRSCSPLTGEKTYSGKISWQKVNNFLVEIRFPGSHYGVSARPEKFDGDWTEARIHACNGTGAYWAMRIECAQPGLVRRYIPSCRD